MDSFFWTGLIGEVLTWPLIFMGINVHASFLMDAGWLSLML